MPQCKTQPANTCTTSAVPEFPADVSAVRADLEKRIKDNRRKIEEMRLFEDDPKFAKIIRTLRQQIAQDSYELSLMEPDKGHD